MNEDDLRALLHGAAEAGWDDDVRSCSALFAGQTLRRSRLHRRFAGSGSVLAVVAIGTCLILIPHAAARPPLAVSCAGRAGTSGDITPHLDGVTLAVSNPTGEVLPVVAGGSTAFAVPGLSQVTLPLMAGPVEVRCGSGQPVTVTVHGSRAASCLTVATTLRAVERGDLGDLTRDRLTNLPPDAVVEPATGTTAVRRVQVRSQGALVAEAVWHEMPGAGDWHLESLHRCA